MPLVYPKVLMWRNMMSMPGSELIIHFGFIRVQEDQVKRSVYDAQHEGKLLLRGLWHSQNINVKTPTNVRKTQM